MKKTLLVIFLFVAIFAYGQDYQESINGFYLKQLREVPNNEFGKCIQEGDYPDGWEYEMFFIDQRQDVYMVFEYASEDLDIIETIQIAGNRSGFDCGIKGLELGMSDKKVKKILGKPDVKEDIGEYGTLWSYNDANYSVEINNEKILSSIKISHFSFQNTDKTLKDKIKTTPVFTEYIPLFASGDREKMKDMIDPFFQLSMDSTAYYFKYSFDTEVQYDKTKLFSNIESFAKAINSDSIESSLYDRSMRVTRGDIYHVDKLKVDNAIYEFVFKYGFFSHRLYEINVYKLKDENKRDEK